MRRFFASAFRIFLSVSVISYCLLEPALAWSLKTHVWIAQQVLNDATADGQLSILGRNYAVPAHVMSALRSHPNRYRMGSLGPDVFPDPVVGQMTTHPGIEGGWQTDDWLKHVLDRAQTPEEIAFAYGFVAHAAGDIFAHTYVNMFAGDIFILTDQEREVELRHFVLEKYIESLTPAPLDLGGNPINLTRDFDTPSAFLRDALIIGGDVSRQNLRSKAGFHLTAMHEVRHAVAELQKGTQDVISSLTKFASQYFEAEIKLHADLVSGKATVQLAKAALAAEEAQLQLKQAAYDAALKALSNANSIVQNHPGLITHNEELLAAQVKVAADAAAEATSIGAEAANAIANLENKISGLASKLAGLVCKSILGGIIKRCQEIVDEINGVREKISVWNLQKEAAERIRDETAKARDDLKSLVDKLKAEYEQAVKRIADKTYEGAVAAAKAELDLQTSLLETKKKALAEAERVTKEISEKIEKITPIIAKLREAIDLYNPVTLLVQKWLDDIDVGAEEYIKASHRAGILMLNNKKPLNEYIDWFNCYGQVFVAVPKEVGQLKCLAKNYIELVTDEFDKAINGLPEIVRWVMFPSRELAQRVLTEIKPELKKAAFSIGAFLTDQRTAEFLEILSEPENATREKLTEVYREDQSGKGLITFDDVATLVDKDLHVENSQLVPEKFPALSHAVTLTKLTLLEPDELNRLVKDVAGNHPFIPPEGVFRARAGNFSILLDAVRSIDGNHQWQAYGLPYPRRLGTSHGGVGHFHYGQDGYRDKNKGFQIWTNTYLREKVFLKLFPEGVLGALGERPELQWTNYKYPACSMNPYPQTQNPQTGAILSEDRTCTRVSNPDARPQDIPIVNESEYRARYFQCGLPNAELPHWTIAGSFRTEASVIQAAERIRYAFPDMSAEVWRPRARNNYWTVMVAACTSHERADEARDLVIRRGIAEDAFVWQPSLPWAKTNLIPTITP